MEILYFLESIRSEWLNQVCLWLSMIGEETVFIVFGAVLIWCIDKKWGFRLFFTSGVSQSVTRLIKGTVQMPRPFERDRALTIVDASEENAPGYSMPSGHSQTAANLLGTYALSQKQKWFRLIMAVFIFAVMFARMELGVHTLWDCLVGAGISFGIVILYAFLFENANGKLLNLAWIAVISLIFMAVIVIYLSNVPQTAFFKPEVNQSCIKKGCVAFGTTLGTCISYLIDRFWVKYDTKAPGWAQIIKVIVGVGLIYGVDQALSIVLKTIMENSVFVGGIRNCLLIVIFLGFYPLTFRFYKRFDRKSIEIAEKI